MSDYSFYILFASGLFVGLLLGYLSNPVHRAKFYNLFGLNKMVVFMAGASPLVHPFVVDKPIGEQTIKIKYKKQDFVLVPNPEFDTTWNNVIIGFFDPRDARQIPLQAYVHYNRVVQTGVNEKGEPVEVLAGWVNEPLLGKLQSPSKHERLLTTLMYAAKLKAQQDNKGFEGKIQTLIMIVAVVAVINLLATLYGVSLTNGAMKLIESVPGAVNATVNVVKAT